MCCHDVTLFYDNKSCYTFLPYFFYYFRQQHDFCYVSAVTICLQVSLVSNNNLLTRLGVNVILNFSLCTYFLLLYYANT